MSSTQLPDDNIITRRKTVTKGIEDIRQKKSEIAQALRELRIDEKNPDERSKSLMKQLIEAFDTLSVQENQYMDILTKIVTIHEQAASDVANDFEKQIEADEKRLKEAAKNQNDDSVAAVDGSEEGADGGEAEDDDGDEKFDLEELKKAFLELKQAQETAVAAQELNKKLVERLQMQKKKKTTLMEIRNKKAKELDEDAAKMRNEVLEKINKLSSLKKSTKNQEKELEELKKQCLTLGLLKEAENHEVNEEAEKAVLDNNQRVPIIAETIKKAELNEEELEKRREEIRENIRKEQQQKEKVNSLIREKLASMEARKKRLQQIRKMLENNHSSSAETRIMGREESEVEEAEAEAEVEAGVQLAQAQAQAQAEKTKEEDEKVGEAKEEPGEPEEPENNDEFDVEKSFEEFLNNAKQNLNNLTAMRERLETIQQNGGTDLNEDDLVLLRNLENLGPIDDVVEDGKNEMKRIVEESFAERFESKTVEAQLIEARLISIESMVRHNQNVLSRIDEKMPSSSIPKIRFDLLTADELRIASTSLLKLSEIRDVDDESRRSSDDIVSRLNSLLLKTIRFDNYSPSELAAHAEAEADASRFNKTLP